MDEIDDAQEALDRLILEESAMQMDEIDLAAAALYAIENATVDIFDEEAEIVEDEPIEMIDINALVETQEVEDEVDESEARLATTDLEEEISEPIEGDIREVDGIRQVWSGSGWWSETPMSEPTGTPSIPNENDYISGIDPIDANTITSNTATITTNASGAIEYINHNIEPIILEDMPIIESNIETENINSEEFDDDEHLTIAEIKESLTPILEDLYPDRWDWNERDEIIVHFPEILITNSKSQRHKIKDLYTKLKYSHVEKRFKSTISGTRLSITNSELNGAYAHSHLPSISKQSIGEFSDFCLGSSTLNYLLSDLATVSLIKTNLEDLKIKFMLSMMETENYLHWESLEGGPFKKISNINSGKLSSMSVHSAMLIAEEIMNEVWGRMLHNLYSPRMKFNHKGLLEILNNDGFLIEISNHCKKEYLVYRDGAGKFFNKESTSDLSEGDIYSNERYLVFNDKMLIPKIIKEDKIYEKSGKDFAHPKIIDWCKQYIEAATNKSWAEELEGKIVTHYNSRTRKTKNTSKNIFTTLTNVRDSIDS